MPELVIEAPNTLEEATVLLARYEGEARAIAGGTALVLMLRQGLVHPPALVRLDRIPGLAEIQVVDRVLRVGALTPLRALRLGSKRAPRLIKEPIAFSINGSGRCTPS